MSETESGQATLEFFLTLMLFLAVTFFFAQTSLVFGWANYIQYATFMSARAYQSGGPDEADQRARAERVLNRMLKRQGGSADRIPALAKGVSTEIGGWDGEFRPGVRASSWAEGVRYKFRSRVFVIPLPGFDGRVELTSESWLGREPSSAECKAYMEDGHPRPWIYDNGC
jgi:hypothetical protein